MKKILILTIVFLVVALVPQFSFAQTDVEPAKQKVKTEKQMADKKEMKATALPLKKEEVTGTDEQVNKKAATPPVAKEGKQPKIDNYIVP
jgi:hypothetical protein